MSQILVAQFDDFDAAHAASTELRSLGMSQGDMEIFALTAPAQPGASPPVRIPERPAGVRLAVHVISPAQRAHMFAAFHRHASRSIEEAEGTWRDSTWTDFDPVAAPRWIEPPAARLFLVPGRQP